MKRLMIIGLWPDDAVNYCTEKCDCRRYAFDRILYHRGGRAARERICIPVVDRSGATTTYPRPPCNTPRGGRRLSPPRRRQRHFFEQHADGVNCQRSREATRRVRRNRPQDAREMGLRAASRPQRTIFEPGDEVDEDLIGYFLDVLPPRTNRAGLLQVGGEISTAKDVNGRWQPTYLTFKRQGGTWRYAGRCFEGSAEPVQKYQSSLERMMLTRCKLLGVVAQEVEA